MSKQVNSSRPVLPAEDEAAVLTAFAKAEAEGKSLVVQYQLATAAYKARHPECTYEYCAKMATAAIIQSRMPSLRQVVGLE